MANKDSKKIVLGHGSGGKLSHELIKEVFFRHFQNPVLAQFGDSAIVELPGCPTSSNTTAQIKSPSPGGRGVAGPLPTKKGEGDTLTLPSPLKGEGYGPPKADTTKVAFTTDSFVVKPLFFPGGDIGKLAISGTVNDLAVMGARPMFLSAAFILEEGLEISLLEKVALSMKETAAEAGVIISTGDTKVVEKGSADGLYINTAGIGIVEDSIFLSPDRIRPGDKLILSGTLGDHGLAILAARHESALGGLESQLKSDCDPLAGMIQKALGVCKDIKFMRDPTRGGLATVLNEVTYERDFGILLYEDFIPVKEEVRAACEILGLEPLYLANEG
ncbi:MAG TPA: hydrogenase expression/formation protein HypE, partial [Candidatus Hypogeohydataceae bacterium YC40]